MIPAVVLVFFSRKRKLKTLIINGMGLALLLLTDAFFTLVLASQTGAYLALAILAAGSWILALFIYLSLSRHLEAMQKKLNSAAYPEMEFTHLSSLGLALLLSLIPGLFTDLLALILYFLPIRLLFGRIFYVKNRTAWEEAAQILSSMDN